MTLLVPLLLLTVTPEQVHVRLVYDGADTGCPSSARLAAAVAVRLGYEPIRDDSRLTVDVQLRRVGESLTARVLRLDAGIETGRRELSSPTADCSELFRAVELAVAMAIEPRVGLVRPPTPPASPPSAAEARVRPEPMPAPLPTTFHLGIGPTGSIATGPTPALGLALLAGLRHGRFELQLGGRVELPASLGLSPGSISTQALLGSVGACLALSVARACVLGELGALRVTSSGLNPPAQQTAVAAGVGARLGAHLALSENLALRPFLDVAAPLARTIIIVDGHRAWATSPVVGTLGLALLLTSAR